MLARKQEINLQLNELVDAVILGVMFWLCHWLRFNGILKLDSSPDIPEFKFFIWALAIIVPFGPFLLELQGYYQYPLEKTIRRSITQITRAGIWLTVLLAISSFLLKLEIPSRSVIIFFALAAPAALILKERIVTAIYKRTLRNGAIGERIIIVGEPEKMREVEQSFTPSQQLEITVVARVPLTTEDMTSLVNAVHEHSIGRVLLAFSTIELNVVQKAIAACELEGVEAWLCADFIRTSIARPTYEVFASRPMLVFRTTPDISWALLVKSLFDRVMALFGLILVSPLMLVVAIVIKITSPGPAFFKQKRAGRHGRPFMMYKFRSMNTNAEMQRAELIAYNVMSGPVFKVEADPRVTAFGRWLRKTSIDELPQLLNVLRGDMSLVGPRPLPVYEVEQFESDSHRRRLSMRPGLTCLWQVRGRNKVTDFAEWVRMDLEYIDAWSLGLDFWILLRTIPVVLFGLGAK
ncbi:MAG TPA: sugar transferase [Chthoniobacterales bacterium]|nr:sugar transferase [Chthoniobacterales bacterium]